MKKLIFYYIIVIGIFLSIMFGVTIVTVGMPYKTSIIFFDVGQGDGILITRGQWQVLIDGGAESRVLLEKLGKYMPFWDRTVDVVIATHPDADHIGAQVGLFSAYDVGTVIATEAFKKSETAAAWRRELVKNNHSVITADKSLLLHMKEGDADAGILRILFPFSGMDVIKIENANDASIVTHLTVGETTFLMMGDLSVAQEKYIETSPVSVLKVGHHGSKTSSSEEFITRIAPHEAIISAGKNNRYGHPSSEVMERLSQHDVLLLETADIGDIVYTCDLKKRKRCIRR